MPLQLTADFVASELKRCNGLIGHLVAVCLRDMSEEARSNLLSDLDDKFPLQCAQLVQALCSCRAKCVVGECPTCDPAVEV